MASSEFYCERVKEGLEKWGEAQEETWLGKASLHHPPPRSPHLVIKKTTTQLPVQILARGGCCESPSVATLGDVGHHLRGRAGGPWSPAALVSMGLSVSALGGWVAPKPGNWSVNSPHGPQRLDFLTPHLCHCTNNARLQCPPSSPLPWPHLTSPAAGHVLPAVRLLDLCRAWRARCKAASCVAHSP